SARAMLDCSGMDLVERELLDAVANADREALVVLADYWIDRVDELAGEQLAARWTASAMLAGFPASHLVFENGRLQWPLPITAGEPLDEQPALFRLSPRYYREGAPLQRSYEFEVFAGEVVTPMRAANHPRVAIKAVAPHAADVTRQLLAREHAILQLVDHPNV